MDIKYHAVIPIQRTIFTADTIRPVLRVEAFRSAFASEGVPITIAEAREPMGLAKRDHIQAITRMARVGEAWTKVHDRAPVAGQGGHGDPLVRPVVPAPEWAELHRRDAGSHERDRVGGPVTSDDAHHAAVGKGPNLHGVGLHHGIAQAHLAVAADCHAAFVTDRQNRSRPHSRTL